MIKGLDVSSYQGTIDFGKVKRAGYDFVIVRAGWGRTNVDSRFNYNVREALRNGLKVGAYWFIYAKTKDDIKGNVRKAHSVLNNFKDSLEMGVYADWEYDSDKYRPKLTNHERSLFVKQFIDEMSAVGYKMGLYANPDYINNKFEMNMFKGLPLWLAFYGTTEANAKKYNPTIWQFSSKERVDGINGNVDGNYFYGEVNVKPIETPVVVSNDKYAIVNTKKDPLNVRKGAGTKYAILTSIPKGSKIKIIDNTTNKTWYKIEYKGIVGWCSKTYLKEC